MPDPAGARRPGRGSGGVVSGLQFLEDVNLGQKDVWVGKRVVTVGGGFTSMDCVRTVLRMGAEQSIMTYRRSIQEIPVDALELEEAEIEGVEIMYMVAPTRVIGDGQGQGGRHRADPQRAGRAGRQGPPPAGTGRWLEFVIHCDMVLVAIGQRQDNRLLRRRGAEPDRRGVPLLDQNLKTELPNVWASGDYVINPTNFISSIGEGKRVAELIDEDLRDAEPKVKEMEITAVPTEFISTPNPLLAEGIAEWTLTAMSRRLGLGRRLHQRRAPDDAGAAAAGPRARHRRHHDRERDRLHQADRLRRGQALPAMPAQHLHRRQPLHPLRQLRRRLPATASR